MLPMTTAPFWLGQIVDHDGALNRLGLVHFVVQLPKVPNWDRKNSTSPYLFIQETPLPKRTTNAEQFANDLDRVKDQITHHAVIQMQVDELTLNEHLKGCKKYKQIKDLEVNTWLAPLEDQPITVNLFGIILLLNNIRFHIIQSQLTSGNYDIDSIIENTNLTYPNRRPMKTKSTSSPHMSFRSLAIRR